MNGSLKNIAETVDEVIIIGAGAAGIAALTKLLKSGIRKVKVLEAEKRIGGRIHSVFLGDAFVDLGAEEVHGEEGNVVVQLASDYLKKKKPLTESVCYLSNGERIDDDIRNDVMDLIEQFCEDDGGAGRSIGEAFTKRFTDTILGKYESSESKKIAATTFLPLCESFFSILEGPYSWFDVVLESLSNYVDCEGDQFLGWNGHGCQTVLDILLGKKPELNGSIRGNSDYEERILLRKSVEKIFWNQVSGVSVECQDGSRYSAKHVICTASVGVLRKKHSDMFIPNLPQNKIDILGKIGFSNVMKVALRYKEKWWNEAPMALIWTEEDKQEKTHWTSLHWLMEAPDNSKVLVAWLTGPETPLVEQLSDDEIKNGVTQVLKKFLAKNYSVPEPEEIIPTRWHSNSNFCGTYSYETPECANLDIPFQTVLSEPLKNDKGKPVVLFAGEATHLTQYSTVNGAILSGFREAERIIEMYNKK